MRLRLSALLMCDSVRMLCRRSASFTSSTRMSLDIASINLRKFSACLRAFAKDLELRKLGDAVDQTGDLAAEILFDVLDRRGGVLHRVVQQRRRDGRGIELRDR